MTVAGITTTGRDLLTKECTKSYTDTPNYCNITPYTASDGNGAGASVFVFVDCTTNEVLPLSQQPEAYQYPGVSTAQNRVLKPVDPSPSKPDEDMPDPSKL
jgi:hypothetical protein